MRLFIGLLVAGVLLVSTVVYMEIYLPLRATHQSASNLAIISIGLLNYHHAYGRFPPPYIAADDGTPMHSWRVLVLPFIEESDIYGQYRFDEPWNGSHNIRLVDKMASVFSSTSKRANGGNTSYFAVIGPETMWAPGRIVTDRDIPNGMSRIALVEIDGPNISWMEPRDLSETELADAVNCGGTNNNPCTHNDGTLAAFANAHTIWLKKDITKGDLHSLLSIDNKSRPAALKDD
jgi:hypothetical protein